MDARTVVRQIERIKEIFQHAQQLATSTHDLDQLIGQLENSDIEFRSIGYEGASMSLAAKDLARQNTLTTWHSFKTRCPHQAIHIHVGLGWALAQLQLAVSNTLDGLDPLLRFRVFDGYGYFDGLFRSRQAIQKQRRPDELLEKFHSAYDQGIGRSIWYRGEGQINTVLDLLAKFSSLRHADLWRGIGIACAYVGGFEKKVLEEIFTVAGPHRKSLATGAVIAATARWKSSSVTDDMKATCLVWCNCSVERAAMRAVDAEPHGNADEAFAIWISKIESELLFS